MRFPTDFLQSYFNMVLFLASRWRLWARFNGVPYLGQHFVVHDGVGGEQHQNRLQQLELLQSVLHQLPQHVNDVPRRRLQTHSLTHLNEPSIRSSHRWDSNIITVTVQPVHNPYNKHRECFIWGFDTQNSPYCWFMC